MFLESPPDIIVFLDECLKRPAPVDLEEQRRAFQAFIEAWEGEPRLAGAYIYNWWGDGGPGDRCYTPRGKPAERLLRAWYQAGRESV